MKKLLYFAFFMNFAFFGTVFGETISINWLVDDNTYAQTTCDTGNDLIIPQNTPTKRGYTFTGWKVVSYTPIEYIKSTGSQWIDTEFIFSGNTVTYKLRFMKESLYNEQSLFGASSNNSNFSGIPYYPVTHQIRLALGNSSTMGTIEAPINTILDYFISINKLTHGFDTGIKNKDDINYPTGYSNTWSGITTGNPVVLFGHNTGNFNIIQRSSYLNYGFQIIQDGILVRDMIPVIHKSGTVCMYDKANDKFYYNAGTGDFIAGPIINE